MEEGGEAICQRPGRPQQQAEQGIASSIRHPRGAPDRASIDRGKKPAGHLAFNCYRHDIARECHDQQGHRNHPAKLVFVGNQPWHLHGHGVHLCPKGTEPMGRAAANTFGDGEQQLGEGHPYNGGEEVADRCWHERCRQA